MSTELALYLQIIDNSPSDVKIYKEPRKTITNGLKVPVIEFYVAPPTKEPVKMQVLFIMPPNKKAACDVGLN